MSNQKIIYFSAEYGLADRPIPIYAGGLGILAGDTLREASNLELPLVGIGIFYRRGFFEQQFDETGWQGEVYPTLDPREWGLKPVLDDTGKDLVITIPLPERQLFLKVWQLAVGETPLYLLDADVERNSSQDRALTEKLYTGDWNLHLDLEYILGVGGVELCRRLNLKVGCWHLNDDHASFSLLARLVEFLKDGSSWEDAVGKVSATTLFTTHTPIKGAESIFSPDVLTVYLDALFSGLEDYKDKIFGLGGFGEGGREGVSFTVLAMRLSRFRNAVSRRHWETGRNLWSFVFKKGSIEEEPLDFVTNGVSGDNWVSSPMGRLYDEFLGKGWERRVDESSLWERVYQIPDDRFWEARLQAKEALVSHLSRFRLWRGEINPNSLFIGFARRFAPYKQPEVLVSSLEHLRNVLLDEDSPVHLFLAGKAHPIDDVGKRLLQRVYHADQDEAVGNPIIFCKNYNIELAKYLVAGVDVWLNTPKPPMEASGTSGMKAAINGVLNASTLDGWWSEAYNGKNGWVVGSQNPDETAEMTIEEINDSLFYLLSEEITPLFYDRKDGLPQKWLGRVRESLTSIAPRFNTRRMLKEYDEKFYSKIL